MKQLRTVFKLLSICICIATVTAARAHAQAKVESSQQKSESIQKMAGYFQKVQSYGFGQYRQNFGTMSLTELRSNIRAYYEANAADPITFLAELGSRRTKSSDPVIFKRLLLQTARKRLTSLDMMLLAAPYLVKAIIVGSRTYQYVAQKEPNGYEITVPRTDITAIIEDVLQGNGQLSKGDTITFYYLPEWRPTKWNFQDGETCLVPLYPLSYQGQTNFQLLTSLEEKGNENGISDEETERDTTFSYGRYPIRNGDLIDRDNHFGFGISIRWNNFKKLILNEIATIESW